jgi:hypothetical protein
MNGHIDEIDAVEKLAFQRAFGENLTGRINHRGPVSSPMRRQVPACRW